MAKKSGTIWLTEQVKRFLLSRYARGEAAWNEEKLAAHFQVSRTPIRDALHELQRQGIILRRQKRGIILRKLSAREISEIYDVRVALEMLAISLAVNHVTARDIQGLKTTTAAINRAVRNKDALLTDRRDAQFHRQLVDISGNRYLKTMIDQFDLLIRAFQLSNRLINSPELLQAPGHEEIIDALAKKDRRRCRNLIQKHINDTRTFLLRQVQR